MTIHDYHQVMTTVGTAALKAHLSEHRQEPIARIVPVAATGLEQLWVELEDRL